MFSPVLLMHSKLSVLFMWRQNTVHSPGAVWAGIGQTSRPWLQEASPRAVQASARSSHPGIDVASSCFFFHHYKHGEAIKIHWPITQVALKGTKLSQWGSFKHNIPDLCYMVLMALLQPRCGHCLMRQNAPAIPARPLQHQQHGVIWDLGLKHFSRWINQKNCETLNYSWVEMTANLIYLSSLIFLLGRGGNLKPFELLCDCSRCHLTAEGSQQLHWAGLPWAERAWPPSRAPALLTQPRLEYCTGHGRPSPNLRWPILHTACFQITQPPLGTAQVYSSPMAGTTSESNPTYAHRQYFFRWISAVTSCRI